MKFNKKSFSLILAVLFVFNTVNFYGIKVNSNQSVMAATINTTVNLLEVQPGTSYNLQKSFQKTIGNINYTFNVTQMPMSQFISTIDQINGKYGIVYVGNNTAGGSKYCAVGPNATKGITAVDPITNRSLNVKSDIYINNNGYQEKYSENDITYKRAGVPVPDTDSTKPAISQPTAEASGLVNFIKSGQLTLFDKSIFTDTTLNNTILFKQFVQYTSGWNNFIETNSSSIQNDIVQNYVNCNQKPTINITKQPLQYRANADGTPNQNYVVQQGDPNYKKLNFNFDMDSSISGAHPVKADLYLDMNSDGLFQPTEALAHVQQTNGGTGFNLQYDKLPSTFFGMLNWKLEVTDLVTKSKNYILGSVNYAGTPKPIKVLQLVPGWNSNFNMDDTSQFPSSYHKMQGVYEMSITRISAKAFSDSFTNGTHMAPTFLGDGKKVPTILNGNYDMVILGFADSYGSSSTESDITDQNAINEIKSFISTGQSVMFTHDTISDAKNMFPNMVQSGTNGWGYFLKNNFRDIIGQSRYADTNNTSGNNIDGTRIPHSQYPNNVKEFGYSYASINGFSTTTSTTKINSGLINSYPYTLSDNINVAITHDQWYQLNLEDENVVPWYTLNGTNLNPLDARNYYYTYSKGNVTFSGTGHSSPAANQNNNGLNNGNKEELQLFVNTVYKASRSADHAPVVNLNAGSYVSKNQDLNFNFTATDPDGDAMPTWKFFIGSTDITSKVIKADGQAFNGPINSAEQVDLKVPKEVLNSLNLNGQFNLQVQVFDSKGAEGNDNKDINYVDVPTISLTSDAAIGYLVGDTADVTLTAVANSNANGIAANSTITFPSTALQTTYDSTAMTLKAGSGWTGIQPVTYDSTGKPISNAVQTNKLSFQLLKPNDTGSPYTVNNTLNYKFSSTGDTTYPAGWPFTLSVRQGEIDVNLLDNAGKSLAASTNVTLTKPDGTKETKQTDATGEVAFNEPSGHYAISATTPDGYSLVSGSQSVDLSYSNYQPKVSLTCTKLEAPTITASTTEWTKEDVKLTLTPPSSFVSAVQTMQYQIAGGQWIDYDTNNTSNNKVSSEGIQNVIARTIDSEKRTSVNSAPVTVKIDKTGPAVNITDTTTYSKDSSGNSIKETKGPVMLHIVATDALIGTVNKTITVTKSSDPSWSDTITLSDPNANKEYISITDYLVNSNDTYTFTATDGLGNISSTQKVVDNLVSLKLNGTTDQVKNQIDLNWNVPGPTQGYSYDVYKEAASDSDYNKIGSTNGTTFVDVNGKDITKPIQPVLMDGDVKLDNKTVHVNFNAVQDVGTSYKYKVNAIGNNDKYAIESNELTIDNESGIKGYYISIDNDPNADAARTIVCPTPSADLNCSAYGQDFYVHVQAIDNAGNISDVKTYHCVPPTKPTISITGIGQTVVQTISNIISGNGSVNASIGGSTGTASPITYKYYLDNDSNNWQDVNEGHLIPVSTYGLHTIYAKAIDPFGDFSINSESFLIIPAKPVITTNIPATNVNNEILWTKDTSATFNVNGSNDNGSGDKDYQYQICKLDDSLNDKKWLPNTVGVVSNKGLLDAYLDAYDSDRTNNIKMQDGIYNIYGRVFANSDSISENSVLKVGLDTTPPAQPQISPASYTNIGNVKIDYGSDTLSGIKTKLYRIVTKDKDDNVVAVLKDWTAYDADKGVTTDVNNFIEAKSIDYAGNESSLASYKVAYDFDFTGLKYDVMPTGTRISFTIRVIIGYDNGSNPIYAEDPNFFSTASIYSGSPTIADTTEGRSLSSVHDSDTIMFDTNNCGEGNFVVSLSAFNNKLSITHTYTLKNTILH